MPASLKGLVACDAADVVKHLATLCGSSEPPLSDGILLVTDRTPWKSLLRSAIPGCKFEIFEIPTTRELIQAPLSLPVEDQASDLVISLDIAAILPKQHRRSFYQATIRAAKRVAVNAAPLGTDLQMLVDRSLDKLYFEKLGVHHEELQAHLLHGLPTPDEAFGWVNHGDNVDIFYAGDVDWYRKRAELLIGSGKWTRLLTNLAARHESTEPALVFELETVPMRRHRRLFMHHVRV